MPACLALLMVLQLAPQAAAGEFESAEQLKSRAGKVRGGPSELLQNDLSGKFCYALPSGWSATKNPFHPHDILVRKAAAGNEGAESKKGSILLELRPCHGSLEHQAQELAAEQEKNLENYSLIVSESAALSSGKKIARVICTGKIGDDEICEILYFLPSGRGKALLMSETVKKDDQKYGLSVIESLATSVQFRKQKEGLLNI